MAIRCSVLGHDFGDPERDRERTERGEEVIVTVREIETCRSCGETRTVSESKEITAAGDTRRSRPVGDTADETTGHAAPPQDTNAREARTDTGDHEQARTNTPQTTPQARSGDDGVEREGDEARSHYARAASESADERRHEPDSSGVTSRDAPSRDAPSRDTSSRDAQSREAASRETASGDGSIEYDLAEGELIGDEQAESEHVSDDHADHEPGRAPDAGAADMSGSESPVEEPEAVDADALAGRGGPTDRDPRTDERQAPHASDAASDIDRIESTTGSRESHERTHGEWPPEPGSDADRATGSGDSTRETPRTDWDSPLGDAANDRQWSPPGETTGRERVPDADPTEGLLVCPACGFTEPVTASALRAGDICATCQRGYLAWETRKG